MKIGGGHFAPKLGGHFELESGGHFKLELGGQYHWNLQNDNGTVNSANNFESSSDELIAYNTGWSGNNWSRIVKTNVPMNSATNNYVYATNSGTTYLPDSISYLVSQCYDLTSLSNPKISFDMKYDIETNYDALYVEYSLNAGTTWNVLGTQGSNWYNSSQPYGDPCFSCVGNQWTGTNTTTANYEYQLATLAAENNVLFRFVFKSDFTGEQGGAWIDNLLISGTLSTNSYSLSKLILYPNPANNFILIDNPQAKAFHYQIFDTLGKIVVENNENTLHDKITISNFSNGLYFIKLYTNDGVYLEKLIKN